MWQLPQPAFAKTSLPAAASPCPAASSPRSRSPRCGVRSPPVRCWCPRPSPGAVVDRRLPPPQPAIGKASTSAARIRARRRMRARVYRFAVRLPRQQAERSERAERGNVLRGVVDDERDREGGEHRIDDGVARTARGDPEQHEQAGRREQERQRRRRRAAERTPRAVGEILRERARPVAQRARHVARRHRPQRRCPTTQQAGDDHGGAQNREPSQRQPQFGQPESRGRRSRRARRARRPRLRRSRSGRRRRASSAATAASQGSPASAPAASDGARSSVAVWFVSP